MAIGPAGLPSSLTGPMLSTMPRCWLPFFSLLALLPFCLQAQSNPTALETGFATPPTSARIRAYWWWLNGNVTREAITRDLEAMAAQGFGGALLCDAGGAEQRGNDPVPHGPDFFSPSWRALYRHALHEADRLGLELSLNIQSGWNLGGPSVAASDAPKKLVWSETRYRGPTAINEILPTPSHPPAFYRDVAVVAYPAHQGRSQPDRPRLSVSSAEPDHPALDAFDDTQDSFWVSQNPTSRQGPSQQQPEWIALTYSRPVTAASLYLLGRPGYGPRSGAVQSSDTGTNWVTLKSFTQTDPGPLTLEFPATTARHYRVLITDAFDRRFPASPRNVQIAELQLRAPDQRNLTEDLQPRRLLNWPEKALHRALHFSAPDTTPLLLEKTARPEEEEARSSQVVDLTESLDPDGRLQWTAPEGEWVVLRFGCTLNDHCRVSTHSEGWEGYALDPFDAEAFQRYWQEVVAPLIAEAGPLAGRTLKYLHTDSWEVEVANWTPSLQHAFQENRGYDLLPFLPVLAGKIVDSRPVSNRFLHDFRKTMGDLAIQNHYRLFSDQAAQHGLLIHPESGGPHAVPVDSLRCLGLNDAPMSEFWAWSWEHRIGDSNRFFVKQPASAAHVYGHNLVLAEGFTTIGPHWQETLWDNLKPAFDRALCEGLNLLVWHTFTCSPSSMGVPGQQYFAGTHLNPNVTWWSRSAPVFAYFNRCQFLLQQGTFVADALYYYGDHVPNFAQLKRSDPAQVLPGYDYDVITEEALLERLSVQDGFLTLPSHVDRYGQPHAGVRYRLLVLPPHPAISLPVLRRIQQLVQAGATVVGPQPTHATGLSGYPKSDREVARIVRALWSSPSPGRVLSEQTAREILLADGVVPDFEFEGPDDLTSLDYIHRRTDDTDIYFVANGSNRTETARCSFRITGKQPELWNPLTGLHQPLTHFTSDVKQTHIPIQFAPFGSWFILFRQPLPADRNPSSHDNFPALTPVQTLSGPWKVSFDPAWGGPSRAVTFEQLTDWTTHTDPGIRFYSGTATYRATFQWNPTPSLPVDGSPTFLDLGQVHELAEIRLNGRELGIVWTPPFRVDVTAALRPGANALEIDVVNFWPNRIIGDASLPPDQQRTRTNIRKLTAASPLMPSGLIGPVHFLAVRPTQPE